MSDNAVDLLAARLALVEERLARLESGEVRVHRAVTPPVTARPVSVFDATLIGKSILIIGGGYLVRALTETGVLAQGAGIALGLVYALFWMFIADRALGRGRVVVALFDAVTAALITAGLIWEATTRFHLITPTIASALIVVASFAVLAVAWRRQSSAVALIAAVLASLTSIGVAVGTGQVLAPAVAATVVGLAISRRWPGYITSIIAAASDSLALSLVVMTLISQRTAAAPVEITLILLAAAWLAGPSAQTVVAATIGLGGAAVIAQFHDGHVAAVGMACLVLSVICGIAAVWRRSFSLAAVTGIAAFLGTILMLDRLALVMAWSAAAALCALAGRRLSWGWLNVHAVFWTLAAAVAAGLPVALVTATDPSAVVVVVGVVAAIALFAAPVESHWSRVVFLAVIVATSIAVIVGGVSDLMGNRAVLAMTRTVVLSIAAVVLAGISSSVTEAKTLARILLVVGGAKLLLEDLPTGRAVTIVVALAAYGCAMVIVARGRSAAGRAVGAV